MKKLVAFLLLFGILANGGCGGGSGGGGTSATNFPIMGYVYDFDGTVDSARVELWTLDGKSMLASADVARAGTLFTFPEDKKLQGRLLLSADVPEWGGMRMLNVIDTTVPTLKSVTPLSTLILETANGDYSEQGIAAAQNIVAPFIGVASNDDYTPQTLIGIIPISEGVDESVSTSASETKKSGFSYREFKSELLPPGSTVSFNNAISTWAVRAHRGEVLTIPLIGDNTAGVAVAFFSWVLKSAATGAVGAAGGQALGWVLSLAGMGDDNNRALLEEMNRKLDEIQKSLHRFEADMKRILAELKLEVAYGAMKQNVEDVQAAYNIHLIEIGTAKLSPERLKEKIDNFIKFYEMKLDVDLLSIHNSIVTNPVTGKGLYKLMEENIIAGVRANSTTLEGAIERYAATYKFFIGVQIKGMLCNIEIINKTSKNDADRKTEVLAEIKLFSDRIKEQSNMFLNSAEVIVSACAQNSGATFYRHSQHGWPQNPPVADNYYHLIDMVAGDSLGNPSQITLRLLFDPNVVDRLWSPRWKEGRFWWHGIYVRTYKDYFSDHSVSDLKGKMRDLESGKSLEPKFFVSNSDYTEPTNKFGSVQRIQWSEAPEVGKAPVGKEAVIMRWAFDKIGELGDATKDYKLAIDHEQRFRLYFTPDALAGTIAENLVAQAGSYEDNGYRIFLTKDSAYNSMTLFAWLPKNYILEYPGWDSSASDGPMHVNQKIAIRARRTNTNRDTLQSYINSYSGEEHRWYLHTDKNFGDALVFVPRKGGDDPVFFSQNQDSSRYDPALYHVYTARSDGQNNGWGIGISHIQGDDAMFIENLADHNDGELYFTQIPSVMAMFLDDNSYSKNAKEPIYMRLGTPVFMGLRDVGDELHICKWVGGTGYGRVRGYRDMLEDRYSYWIINEHW